MHRTLADLEAALPRIECSPREAGTLELIVARPARGERAVLASAVLDVDNGLVGDRWAQGKRNRVNQLTLMNSRVVDLLAGARERWPLAGDQLYVDLDLSEEHLPPGTRLAIGSAVIAISPEPHLGCRLFRERFGADAVRFVNSPLGERLKLRGLNAWVEAGGAVATGARVQVLFD
jgi:hypothetical protein